MAGNGRTGPSIRLPSNDSAFARRFFNSDTSRSRAETRLPIPASVIDAEYEDDTERHKTRNVKVRYYQRSDPVGLAQRLGVAATYRDGSTIRKVSDGAVVVTRDPGKGIPGNPVRPMHLHSSCAAEFLESIAKSHQDQMRTLIRMNFHIVILDLQMQE